MSAKIKIPGCGLNIIARDMSIDKRRQDFKKQKLVKKLKEIEERKKNGLPVSLRRL